MSKVRPKCLLLVYECVYMCACVCVLFTGIVLVVMVVVTCYTHHNS